MREQGNLEIAEMVLKGEEAWPETQGWRMVLEGRNGVMVTESRGAGCSPVHLPAPAEKEELGQRLRGGRAGRRAELGSSTVAPLLWRGTVTQRG